MAFYSYLSTKIIIAFITKSYQDLFGVRSYINAIIISAGILAYLFSSGRQVFQPVISHCLSQMQAGSLAFVNSMGTHRVRNL